MVVCVLVGTVLTVVPFAVSTAVPETGGSVASADGRVVVDFPAGAVSSGTRIRVRTGLGGPVPPPYITPLARPFDVEQVIGHARTGTVSVRHGALPVGVPADAVVMLVEEPVGWRILDAAYDERTGVLSAGWPHFSRGLVGFVDPLFDAADATAEVARDAADGLQSGVERGAEWTARQYDAVVERSRDLAAWTAERRGDLAAKVVEGVVAATGGTTHEVECTPNAGEWAFEGTGPGTAAALTGCAEPLSDDTASWPVHVGNRLPYAMLLRLPAGLAPPGFVDSFVDLELEDLLISMLWSLEGLTVLPAGEDVRVSVERTAGSTVQVDGYTDATTLGVKALGLIAAGFSRGGTAAARAELKGAMKAKRADKVRIAEAFERFFRERRARDTSYSNADVAEDAVPDSDIAGRLRQARRDLTAAEADEALLILAVASCAIAQRGNVNELVRTGKIRGGIEDVLRELFDRCFEPAVKGAGALFLGVAKDRIGPGATKKLLDGLLAEALNVRELAAASIAAKVTLESGGDKNYLQGRLIGRCTGAPCGPPPDTVLDPPAPVPGTTRSDDIDWAAELNGRLFCAAIDPDVFVQRKDYTGDGLDETVVSYRCAVSPSPSPRGEPYSQVEVFDGRSRPGALVSLGILVRTPPASVAPSDAMTLGMVVTEVYLEEPSVRVVGWVYPYGNPPCPIYNGTVSATWNGTDFTVQDRQDRVAYRC